MIVSLLQCLFCTEFSTKPTFVPEDQCLQIEIPKKLIKEMSRKLSTQISTQAPLLAKYVKAKTLPTCDIRDKGIRITRRQDKINDQKAFLDFYNTRLKNKTYTIKIDTENPVMLLGSPRTNGRVFFGYPVLCQEIFDTRAALTKNVSGFQTAHKTNPKLMGNGKPIFLHITFAVIRPDQGMTLKFTKGETVCYVKDFKQTMLQSCTPEAPILSSDPKRNKREVLKRKDIHRAALEGYYNVFKSLLDKQLKKHKIQSILNQKDQFGRTLQARINQAVKEKIKGADKIEQIIKESLS